MKEGLGFQGQLFDTALPLKCVKLVYSDLAEEKVKLRTSLTEAESILSRNSCNTRLASSVWSSTALAIEGM